MNMKAKRIFINWLIVVSLFGGVGAYSAPAPASTSSARPLVWYGVASDSSLLDTNTPAVSAMLRVTDILRLQAYVVLQTVNPLLFSGGAAAKFNAVGTWERGLHVGAGFGMGDQGAGYFSNVAVMAGAHFEVVKNILISTDSGFRLHLAKSSNFSISGNSAWLGASVHFGI